MPHTCSSAVSKVLAVSRKKSMPSFAYTYNCFESTCLPNFKESLCLQISPQYFFTWPLKSLWLWGHWQRWVRVSSTHLSSPPRAPTEGTLKLLMVASGRHNCKGKWLMDCHASSEGPAHASMSQEVCVCFFLFEKMKSTWVGGGRGGQLLVWFYFQNAPEVK